MEAADSVVQEVGWPFLVSAGLVRDYTVLVAPDFLVADGEQGLLGIAGGAVDGGPIESRTVRTSSGRLLALSYAARLLTAEDSTGTVADEFGRPLRLVVGVVTDGSRATDPTRDLARAEDGRPAGVPPVPGGRVRVPGRAVPPGADAVTRSA